MKHLTKVLSMLLCTVMLTGVVPLPVLAAANSVEEAGSVPFDTEISGELATRGLDDYYKIVLEESGALTIDMKAFIYSTRYELLDCSGNLVYNSGACFWNASKQFHGRWTWILVSGTYYWRVVQYDEYDGYGSYLFFASFESSNETFHESQTMLLNSRATAPNISIGNRYVSLLTKNDTEDLYKLDLREQRSFFLWDLDRNSINRFVLFDYAGDSLTSEMWGDQIHSCTLDAGIYYLKVYKHNNNVGNCTFLIYTPGDLDNDGLITPADARTALRMSVDLEPCEEGTAAFAAADFNRNGLIFPDDARSILRVSVGLEP